VHVDWTGLILTVVGGVIGGLLSVLSWLLIRFIRCVDALEEGMQKAKLDAQRRDVEIYRCLSKLGLDPIPWNPLG